MRLARMRRERGAPARLRSGRARLFPSLCFKLRAEPFNFIPLSPFFLLLIFLVGEGEEGPVFPSVSRHLARVLAFLSVVAPGEGRAG